MDRKLFEVSQSTPWGEPEDPGPRQGALFQYQLAVPGLKERAFGAVPQKLGCPV